MVPGRSFLAAAVILAVLAPSPAARGATPDSPEVKRLVAKAIQFLERRLPEQHRAHYDLQVGAKALVGLCLLKHFPGAAGQQHPKVVEALDEIRQAISPREIAMDVYSTGLALLFLSELSGHEHRPDMERLLAHLLEVQKPNGAWGYPGRETGDTSMTQYGILGLWAANKAGLPAADEAWERVIGWLVRTQDPRGAYGYQGVDPGEFQLVPQDPIRPSLTAAGMGSLYICADHLHLASAPSATEKLPKALKRRSGKGNPNQRLAVPVHLVAAAKARGDEWLKTSGPGPPARWTHYYLYALERYHSFKELAEGGSGRTADWYDAGVKYLARTQHADGSWRSAQGRHVLADTAFSVLFLMRSTRAMIERNKKLGGGTLAGGRGLPDRTDQVRLRLGTLAARPLDGPAEQLLAIMADPSDDRFLAAVEGLEDLLASGQVGALDRHSDLLRALAENGPAAARAAALRALGRLRNLDDVPLLIAALDDGRPTIYLAAHDALRFISRRLDPESPGVEDVDARQEAVDHWKAWFLSIRPAAHLDL